MTQGNFLERKDGGWEIVREEEIKLIERGIRRQEYMAVSASYQSGLSTFLQQAVSHIQKTADIRDHIPVLVEQPDWEDDFLLFLSTRIAERVTGQVKDPQARYRRFASTLAQKGLDSLLKSAFGKSSDNVILFVDNFHSLPDGRQRQFVKDIRRLLSYKAKSPFIRRIMFVIGANLFWQRIDPDRISPFSNASSHIFLGDFGAEQTVDFVSGLFKRQGMRMSEEAAEHFYEITRGHPYFVNTLCRILLRDGAPAVGAKELEKGVERLLEHGDEHLRNLRDRIFEQPREEFAPLAAILQGKVVRKSNFQPDPRLDNLILLGLLSAQPDGRVQIRNSIYSRFFRSDLAVKERLLDGAPVAPCEILCQPMSSINTRGYRLVNRIENAIRNFITLRLYKDFGEQWLELGMKDIATEPERETRDHKAERDLPRVLQIRKEREDAELAFHCPSPLIGYATLKELEAIVVKNWKNSFRDILRSQDCFRVYLTNLNRIRNKLAHNRRISDEELLKLREIELEFKNSIGEPI